MGIVSAVEFKNDTRVHIGMRTSAPDSTIAFYSRLLGHEPVKVKTDYAKFESDDPSISLSLTAGRHDQPGRKLPLRDSGQDNGRGDRSEGPVRSCWCLRPI